jgi:hypothetical protein
MRYKLLGALVFISCAANAQQINPVPDYVFANRMSVGRNAVTDTLAYFSIGPRYGAIRGFMPPMVVDTALVTGGTKRNGLTIFSIQKNKYVYWDSVGSKWAEMAGTGGSAINSGDTASMLSSYTRGSGTTNYLPKFTGTRTFGNSVAYDNGGTELLVNTTTDAGAYALQVAGSIYNTTGAVFAASSGGVSIGTTSQVGKLNVVGSGAMTTFNTGAATDARIEFHYNNSRRSLFNIDDDAVGFQQNSGKHFYMTGTNSNVGIGLTNPQTRFAINIPFTNVNDVGYLLAGQTGTSTRVAIVSIAQNTTTGASAMGFYTFSGSALEKARIDSSGNLGLGTTSPSYKLDVTGDIRATTTLTTGAPTSGSAKPWRLGEAATVSPTSPNRTIRVEIDGTVYYIHAKTTND